MATKLFLRSTQNNAIGATYFDMLPAAGSGTATAVVDTAASGTEIQWTQTAGGAVIQWVSGRAPAGGFTLTSTDISVWARESNGQANAGGRYRVFKRAANGTETELGGGPFNDGVEFGTSAAEMTWTGNVTDTAFAEDDRILLKLYITNVGTMGGNRTCTLTYNGADAATGDSFFNIAETVSFKAESTTHATSGAPTGQGTTLIGSAAHIAIHGSTGSLAGPGSAAAGTAARVRAFAASGALNGTGAVVSGGSARLRAFGTSGELGGSIALIDAASDHIGSSVSHATDGTLNGEGSHIAGSVAILLVHEADGLLASQGAMLAGSFDRERFDFWMAPRRVPRARTAQSRRQ